MFEIASKNGETVEVGALLGSISQNGGQKTERRNRSAYVRGGRSSGHWNPGDLQGDGQGVAEKRDGQMLWR